MVSSAASSPEAAASGQATWNVTVYAVPGHVAGVRRLVPHLDGVRRSREVLSLSTVPLAFDGRPAADYLAEVRARSGGALPSYGLYTIDSPQGVDLARGERPDAALARDPLHPGSFAGRLLDASDAGTSSALGGAELLYPPWNLRPGDTITMAGARSGVSRTVTLVGFFERGFSVDDMRSLQVDRAFVAGWDGADAGVITYLSVDPARSADAVRRLNAAEPSAIVFDLGMLEAGIGQVLRNLLVVVSAVASLAVLAATVIIANAVALAVIERRREIAIMKAVGFRAGSVLLQLVLENAVAGSLAGASAILLVAAGLGLGSRTVLGVALDASPFTGSALVLGSAALGAVVAGLVAWGPARARPLEVLRQD
jgi:hypothetical protein